MTGHDLSTVLAKKVATFLPDLPDSGAEEIFPGFDRAAVRGRLEIGGRLVLTPGALWFHPHRFNIAPMEFGIPLDEVVAIDDVSEALRRKVRFTLRSGARPTFLVWGIPGFVEKVQRARGAS